VIPLAMEAWRERQKQIALTAVIDNLIKDAGIFSCAAAQGTGAGGIQGLPGWHQSPFYLSW